MVIVPAVARCTYIGTEDENRNGAFTWYGLSAAGHHVGCEDVERNNALPWSLVIGTHSGVPVWSLVIGTDSGCRTASRSGHVLCTMARTPTACTYIGTEDENRNGALSSVLTPNTCTLPPWSWCQPWRVWICFACYRDGTRSGVVIVSTRTLPELQTLARFRRGSFLHHGTHSAPPVIM